MPAKVHLDGRVQDVEGACIPVDDHGFLFGDSVFETLRALGGRCARVPAHLARLRRSAESCRLALPWDDATLLGAMEETVRASGEADAAVRLIVTRGSGPLEADPTPCTRPRLLVFARARRPVPPDVLDAGARLVVARGVRRLLGAHPKTGNYLDSVLALAEAREAGAFEAILLNTDGRVAECAGANLFLVRSARVLTPPAGEGILPGIARAGILESCAALGIPHAEEPIPEADLADAEEAFLTSTLKEVVPVAWLGVHAPRVSPGPLSRMLLHEHRRRLVQDTTS